MQAHIVVFKLSNVNEIFILQKQSISNILTFNKVSKRNTYHVGQSIDCHHDFA